jgi:flagellar biosynthetic protein FliQ
MNETDVVHVLKLMSITGLKVAGPILGAVLAVGVLVSLIQTITQIQEQAIVYVLKFGAVATVLLTAGPWMLQEVIGFVHALWGQAADVGT